MPVLLRRTPGPLLAPFVRVLWVSDGAQERAERELVLPTGSMHVVLRLGDEPLCVYDGLDDRIGRSVGHCVVGGARSTFYVRDVSRPGRSVGAELLPGAAPFVLGVPADELCGRHTNLQELWGRAASRAREQVAEATSPRAQLDRFESLLIARLPADRGIHPAVADALSRVGSSSEVGHWVDRSGYSHRRFLTLFSTSVGLTPKVFVRVRRFGSALARMVAEPSASLSDIALVAGYSDQPHFNRDFRAFAGVSPSVYRRSAPDAPHHVPLADFKSVQDRAAAGS